MDTRQLQAFCEVVERKSFSQAAERLGVTQPAVSLKVRALEKRLGTQLLDRSGRRTLAVSLLCGLTVLAITWLKWRIVPKADEYSARPAWRAAASAVPSSPSATMTSLPSSSASTSSATS